MAQYPPPVDALLTLGDPRGTSTWRDYPSLGLGTEHIPELIRMAIDPELNWADSDTREVWAPVHAWRALGQLRAEAAVAPLLGLLQLHDENGYVSDWTIDELPQVLGMIGPAAVPELKKYMAVHNREYEEMGTTTASG